MSPRFHLDIVDLKKIGKGALFAIGASLVTYLIAVFNSIHVTQGWLFYAMPLISIGLNAASKWIADHTPAQ